MMTTTEILNEISRLPINDQTEIKKNLLEKIEMKDEILTKDLWQKLFEEGLITHVPNIISDENDDFEPIEISGEPISETIIRERR